MAERSQKDVWRLTPWLVVALLLGNFVLMAFDARDINSGQRVVRVWSQTIAHFIQSPVTTVSSGVSSYFRSFANMRSAQSENDQLKQRIQELEVEIKQKEDLTAENDRLKSLLDLKEQSKYKVLTARVIGRDASAWFDSAIINRGSLDGVKLNMPVVTDGGLVGRVTAVSPLTAQVDLITRNKSGLGGVIGEVGYVQRARRGQRDKQKGSARNALCAGQYRGQGRRFGFYERAGRNFSREFEDRRDRGCAVGFGNHSASDSDQSERTARFDAGSRRFIV